MKKNLMALRFMHNLSSAVQVAKWMTTHTLLNTPVRQWFSFSVSTRVLMLPHMQWDYLMSLDFILFHAFFCQRQHSDDEKSKQQTRLFHSSLKLFLCTGKFKELEREFFFSFRKWILFDWLVVELSKNDSVENKKKLSRRGKNCFRWLNNLERVGFCWVLQFTGSFIHLASHSETFSEAHPTWTCADI